MYKHGISLFLAFLLTIGCTNALTSGSSQPEVSTSVFTLPSIPDSLITPASRAGYLAEHYWDNVNFRESTVKLDSAAVEQAFVDFIDLLRLVEDERLIDRAIGLLVKQSTSDDGAYRQIADLTSKYLYETESPMLDEDTYLRFLNVYRLYSAGDKASVLRIDDKVERIGRNRPGTTIPDLRLIYFDGKPTTLYALTAESPAILLIYDNDCEYCSETVTIMTSDPKLTEKLEADKIVVVAIDLGDRIRHLPISEHKNWIWTWAVCDINPDITYRDTPSIYVIGQDKTILIKDASYDYVSSAIFH